MSSLPKNHCPVPPAPQTDVCQSCKVPHSFYYICAYNANLDNYNLFQQVQDQKTKIEALNTQIEQARNREQDAEKTRLRRQIVKNIEAEIKKDYFKASHHRYRNDYQGSDYHSISEVRSWVKNTEKRITLDHKWRLGGKHGLHTFHKCMHEITRPGKATSTNQLNTEAVIDYQMCCNLLLDLDKTRKIKLLNQAMQYLNLLDKLRKRQNASHFLY